MSYTDESFSNCPNCGNHLDKCNCVCPYCGEVARDDCAIGYARATGG